MLPSLINGSSRTCFGVTEPNTGLDTLKLTTLATRSGSTYSITGQKIWISSAQVATKMVLLARTTPLDQVKRASEGLSLFFIDFDKSKPGLSLNKIKKMGGRAIDANEVFFDGYEIPSDTLIGEEGQGFKIVLYGMNAERCLLAGEALGLGYAALYRASRYAKERIVFGRPIGMNQGIQHPLAEAYMHLEAAKLATYHAARLYDQSLNDSTITQNAVGVACNIAKFLAAEAAFRACERSVLAMGGMGYAREYVSVDFVYSLLIWSNLTSSKRYSLNLSYSEKEKILNGEYPISSFTSHLKNYKANTKPARRTLPPRMFRPPNRPRQSRNDNELRSREIPRVTTKLLVLTPSRNLDTSYLNN